jgi:hypothetical protein
MMERLSLEEVLQHTIDHQQDILPVSIVAEPKIPLLDSEIESRLQSWHWLYKVMGKYWLEDLH